MPTLRYLSIWLLAILWSTTPARAQGAITIVSSAARPDFPTEITFALTAESGAEIREVQLLYGAARAEALTIVDLAVQPAPRVSVEHTLDTQVYYSPPGTEMVYRWRVVDASGAVLESEPQQFLYHDERFAWSELSERNVTVYWYEGGPGFGQELMEVSLRTLDRLQADIGAQLDLPVRLYIYASGRDMRSALQANEVEWVGGQAWPGLGVIVGAIESGNSREIQRLIPHEISHQVLHQAIDNPYGGAPVWFDEGLAVHNQEVRDGDYDELVATAAREGRLIPLEALSSGFPADPEQARLSYAQSRDMVEYIIATYGREQLQELVRLFAEATPVEDALRQVLGRGVDALDAEWQGTLAEVAPAPTPQPGPQRAPADRFSEPPVLPDGAQPAQPAPAAPDPQPADTWMNGIADLPPWLSIGGIALCGIVGVALVGVVLLVLLRLIGVDKRV